MSWEEYATCRDGIDPEWFFDSYENNTNVARAVDQMCLSCPVIKQCYEEAVENKAFGAWGGVFLKSGKVDREANKHKTDSIWDMLKDKHT